MFDDTKVERSIMDIKVWSENAKNGTPIFLVNKNGKEFRLKY